MTNDLPSLLAAIAGVILSLAFSYVPGLSTWYANQTPQAKSLTMLGCLVLATMGAYAVTCLDLFSLPGLVCGETGIKALLSAFILALAANQSTYLSTRKLRQ